MWVATDARRREVYWARYADGERVSGPDVQRPAVLAGQLGDSDLVLGSGAGASIDEEKELPFASEKGAHFLLFDLN